LPTTDTTVSDHGDRVAVHVLDVKLALLLLGRRTAVILVLFTAFGGARACSSGGKRRRARDTRMVRMVGFSDQITV